MDNNTITGKFASGKSIRSLFFLLYNGTFRRKSLKEERRSNKNSSNSEDEAVAEGPESRLAAFEEYISKKILAAGLDLRSCKAIRGHGKMSLLLFS